MKVAFVSANRERLPDPVVPLGVISVASCLPENHEASFIDLCFSSDPLKDLEAEIGRIRPDLVAVGLRNLQSNEYSSDGVCGNQVYYEAVFKSIRQATTAPVVVGGGGFSVAPDRLMRLLRPDFGIMGEGEVSFPELVRRLACGSKNFSDIANLWLMKGEEAECLGHSSAPLDINRLPSPRRDWVDPRYYQSGVESVQTKRGCSLSCDYCTYPLIEGRNYRLKDPEKVVEEMAQCVANNPLIRHFFIVDSVFNIPASHAKAICQEMVRRKWEIPWTCYANPLTFDEELAELMVRSRCAGMEVGSDSGSDVILKRLRKGFTTQRIEHMRRICKAKNLKDCHTFILGTPGETPEDVQETLLFVERLDPYAAVFMIWSDDGSLISRKEKEDKVEWRARIREMLLSRRRSNRSWIVPEIGVNFDPNFFKKLRRLGFVGPLWQAIRN